MALRVGVIGCGNISDIYVTNSRLFRDIEIVACADMLPAAAERLAAKFGLRPLSVEALLGAEDIDIVLNLTIPAVHAEIARRALASGKHVFGEKPLATSLADGQAVLAEAVAAGLRVGSAPDTILGAGIQSARQIIDSGRVGTILTGLAAVMSKGMEHWHPNPAFFYQAGAGPVLDLGPYYVSALTTLLGPVASVRATGQISPVERRYGGDGPNKGKTFPVETFTTLNAILSFESGANVSFMASWDVWRHGVRPFELYGTLASIRVPDPDTFGGDVEVSTDVTLLNPHNASEAALVGTEREWDVLPTTERAYGRINYPTGNPIMANYRALGLAEMANAIVENRPHRCSGQFALHALAVMLGIIESATTGSPVEIGVPGATPAPFSGDDAARLLRGSLKDVAD